jgi:hypothetical protein
MSLILANIIGWITLHKRMVAILAAIVLIAVVAFVFTQCGKKAPVLSEPDIQRGEQAVKDGNDAELKSIIVNSVANEKIADQVAANGTADKDAIVRETQQTWGNANREQLQVEFDKRKQ